MQTAALTSVHGPGPQGARLVVGVAEVLDLGLRELAHAQQARARRDLVAVGLPDLRGRERQLAAVVVQQVPARPAIRRTSVLG
jgi:hypothetical protein